MARNFDLRSEQVRDLILDESARVVADDGLLVIPTDTVYGIAADAFSAAGVARLLAAKGRGRDMPPPVLIGQRSTLLGIAEVLDQRIMELTERFWPGPLTIVCPAQPSLDWDLGDTHGTVAVRMPDHPLALELLARTGPLAVSSANTSGAPAAVTAAGAQEMLGDSVDVYLDGGEAPGQASSTIVDMTSQPPRILRAGPIGAAALREIVADLADPEGPDPDAGS
ncbi:L-threonylcarbamoyladenylate synthase [Brevibacterium sp. BRM-1]|uniref:L-threonylcarbamoyladenylate synthase n=1 Tax=Brevibacterium sp. BRM-1 TaxID=2999062 RepID=UPI002281FA67|nr:L-threonylcarbamoyladenylate synthase [Brevibacterium sp. BRM-1]WAL40530.1 L-threonylcarbamoyladenylate synthase [Brevibacterium sp. BRM-1]